MQINSIDNIGRTQFNNPSFGKGIIHKSVNKLFDSVEKKEIAKYCDSARQTRSKPLGSEIVLIEDQVQDIYKKLETIVANLPDGTVVYRPGRIESFFKDPYSKGCLKIRNKNLGYENVFAYCYDAVINSIKLLQDVALGRNQKLDDFHNKKMFSNAEDFIWDKIRRGKKLSENDNNLIENIKRAKASIGEVSRMSDDFEQSRKEASVRRKLSQDNNG